MKHLDSDVKNLCARSIFAEVTPFDWDNDNHVHRWSVVQPDTSTLSKPACISLIDYWDDIEQAEEEIGYSSNINLWREYVVRIDNQNSDQFIPVLNFYYDIPESANLPSACVLQGMLRHLPVVIVLVDEKPKLAATHEHPTLALAFCRAFYALGFFPPIELIDIPEYIRDVEPSLLFACDEALNTVISMCHVKRTVIKRARTEKPALVQF